MKTDLDWGAVFDLIPTVMLLACIGALHLVGWGLWALWVVFWLAA